MRLDKWLWCARIFKTRTLAATAADGGKVHLNGSRVKRSREIRPGDLLAITRGPDRLEIVVRAVTDRRGPAALAEALYAETDGSLARQQARSALRRRRALANPAPAKRPDKKARRQIIRFTQGGR